MKRGRFTSASQRRHAMSAFRLVGFSAASLNQHQYELAYHEAIEAQKHLIVVLGIADEEIYFPQVASKGEGE